MRQWEWILKQIVNSQIYANSNFDKEFIIWGVGDYGERVSCILQECGRMPVAYVDSDVNKQGGMFHGVRVMSPDVAIYKYPKAQILLAVNEKNAESIMRDLAIHGKEAICIDDFFYGQIKLLEIGPLHNPTFKGSNVKYFDVVNAEQLVEKAKFHNLPIDRVPETIHYVSPDGSWMEVHEMFDFVYSSHVIEHQTDFIRHIKDVGEHINVGGAYVLIIPDKRYCFDYYKPCTTIEDVLVAYYEKRKRHSLISLLRPKTHNVFVRHWKNDHGEPKEYSLLEYNQTVSRYFDSLDGDYIDVHEWQFTPQSFEEIMYKLKNLGLINYTSIDIEDTKVNDVSFYACIRK